MISDINERRFLSIGRRLKRKQGVTSYGNKSANTFETDLKCYNGCN